MNIELFLITGIIIIFQTVPKSKFGLSIMQFFIRNEIILGNIKWFCENYQSPKLKCVSVISVNRSEDDVQCQGEPLEDSDNNEDQNKISNKYVASMLSIFSELLIKCPINFLWLGN